MRNLALRLAVITTAITPVAAAASSANGSFSIQLTVRESCIDREGKVVPLVPRGQAAPKGVKCNYDTRNSGPVADSRGRALPIPASETSTVVTSREISDGIERITVTAR